MSVDVRGGKVYHGGRLVDADLHVEDGVVQRVGDVDEDADDVVDADGCVVLPGCVDVHVHFREPGHPHKETWATGSRSAAAGGVTTVVDQPNTDPPTVDGRGFDLKAEAARRSVVDYGLNGGVTSDWRPDELFERPVAAVGEVFMADSTGEMGVDVETFEDAVRLLQDEGYLVTVHAEDSRLFEDVRLRSADDWSRHRPPAAEVAAVERAIEAADEPLHFAHLSHPDSVAAVERTRHTCEVTPHHLLLSRDDLDGLGTLGKMNPPLRSEEARREMWHLFERGVVDCVATDHAPHTLEEKQTSVEKAPSGVPGVETMLPLLLERVRSTGLSLDRVVTATSLAPAEIYGFGSKRGLKQGEDADVVVVDLEETETLRATSLHSRCDWTPFEGREVVRPRAVLRRGEVVYRDGDFPVEAGGRNVIENPE
ncbi:MAG: dihydroorotase [Halobacteriales archaeon]